jgi:hypothetical protein
MRRPHSRSAAVLLALVLCTCTDAPTGPRQRQGRIALDPVYSREAHDIAQSLSAVGLAIDKVFVEVRGAAGDVRASQVVDFPADQGQTALTFSVRLTSAREQVTATLQLRSGTTPIFASATPVTMWQSQTTVARTAPLIYVGPGAAATLLKVQPPQATIAQTGSQQFAAAASAANQSPVSDLPITEWTSSDPTIATVTPAGLVQGLKSGTVTITARALNLLLANASLHVVGLPARVAVLVGTAQNATVGTTLPEPFQVQVMSAAGEGVPGVTVNFQAITAGSSVGTATATTDGQGLASTTATLGTAAGAYEFRATVASAGTGGAQPASITATAQAGAAASIAKVAGDAQSGTSGQPLAAPLVVRVADSYGNPVGGAGVIFTRISGNGTISTSNAVTSADGLASTAYTLGTAAGTESIRADVSGVTGVAATFSLTSTAGAPTAVAPVTRGAQHITAGGSLSGPLVALVTDSHGNPVPGANVMWRIVSGFGSLSADHSSTNAMGEASVNVTADGRAGTTLVTASIGESSVQFTIVVDVGEAAQMSIAGGNGQSAVVGSALQEELSVLVVDAHGNPVPGVAVTFVLAANSGSLTAGGTSNATITVATDAAGVVRAAWRLGGSAGAQSVNVSSLGLSSLGFTATAVTGAASQLTIVTGSNNQSAPAGTAVAVAPSVRITDTFGNPVAGLGVTFTPREGSGAVAGSSATTDANGVAKAGSWTLGVAAGLQTIDVVAGSLTGPLSATALPTLTITMMGRGTGTVSSQPAGVSCDLSAGSTSGTCSSVSSFNEGVTLTAAGASNSTFDGFSGVCAGKNPCSVTMSQSQSIAATFSRVQRTLTIARAAGNGAVVSSPAGINCAVVNGVPATSGCTGQFEDGTPVTLNETPNAGFKFVRWGDPCSGSSACVVSMTQDQAASATFSLGSWTTMSIPTTAQLHGIWGSSPSAVFAVGAGGTILKFDGYSWTSVGNGAIGSNLWNLWGSSESGLVAGSDAVSGQSQLVRYNGAYETTESLQTVPSLYGVWGTSAADIYVCGDRGTFLHSDGKGGWDVIPTGTSSLLFSIWGSSPNDIYIVGFDGTALHYNGYQVTPIPGFPDITVEPNEVKEALGVVWGSSPNDVWIGGGFTAGDLWHFDGAKWTKSTLWKISGSTGQGINGLWGSSSTDIWAVGQSNAYHFDGATWTPAALPTAESLTLNSVWGAGPLDVFATGILGSSGVILRYR